MKKLKNILVIGILVSAPFTFTQAQSSQSGLSKTALLVNSNSRISELSNMLSMQNKAGFKAMKDIAARFKNASNVKWFVGSNIISASVINDRIKNSVYYTKNGRWIGTIKNYNESEMPADVRELVKRSEYFDDNILHVWEVQNWDLHYYVVHLENKTTANEIIVNDGEITLYKTFKKQ